MFNTAKIFFRLTKVNKNCYTAFSSSANYKEKKITIGKWDINYLKVGNGPHTLLCVPGILGTIWTAFKPQIEAIDREKFTLIAWDPPGFGKSRPPERDFPVDVSEKDADFTYQFMKALSIPKCSVLGWSHGGQVSMILAAKYPDVVNKLILISCVSRLLPEDLEAAKKIRDVNIFPSHLRDAMTEIYGEELYHRYWAAWADSVPALYQAKNGDVCSYMLKDIKCPTFIFFGQNDPITHPSHAPYLHSNIKGSKMHLYPNGKHTVHHMHAEDFNRRMVDFLLQPH